MCNGTSAFFPCIKGVRQCENLSSFLFSIFLNDLENYFLENHDPELSANSSTMIVIYFKLFVILFADDTVMFCETLDDLQRTLNAFSNYCTHWKLTVNVSKTSDDYLPRQTERNYQFLSQ